MKTKDLGAAHEIEFALECIERGATVSQPLGDNASYDFILDVGGKLLRVQCKRGGFETAIPGTPGTKTGVERWSVGTTKPSSKKAYTPAEIDFIVSRCGSTWYIWAIEEDFPTSIKTYPTGDGTQTWEKGRDKWSALGLPAARLSDRLQQTEDAASPEEEVKDIDVGGDIAPEPEAPPPAESAKNL